MRLGSRLVPRSIVGVPCCAFIIAHFKRFVKREFFADFSRSFFTRCTLITHLGVPCGDFPLNTLIVSYFKGFVKGFLPLF